MAYLQKSDRLAFFHLTFSCYYIVVAVVAVVADVTVVVQTKTLSTFYYDIKSNKHLIFSLTHTLSLSLSLFCLLTHPPTPPLSLTQTPILHSYECFYPRIYEVGESCEKKFVNNIIRCVGKKIADVPKVSEKKLGCLQLIAFYTSE